MTFIRMATSPTQATSRTGKSAYFAGIRIALFFASIASGNGRSAAGAWKLDAANSGKHHATRYAPFGYFFLHVFSLLGDVSHGINLPIDGNSKFWNKKKQGRLSSDPFLLLVNHL